MDASPNLSTLSPRRWLCCYSGFLLLALAGLTGCTPFSGFRREFAYAQHLGGHESLAGAWSGSWSSHCTGHTGCLKAVICPCGEGRYSVRFHATFLKILSGEYTLDLTATRDGDTFRFQGSKRLPKIFGGTYYFDGYATADEFICNYRCCKDEGVFSMRRVSCCTSCNQNSCDTAKCD